MSPILTTTFFYLQEAFVKAHSKLLTHDCGITTVVALLLRALVDNMIATLTERSDEMEDRFTGTARIVKTQTRRGVPIMQTTKPSTTRTLD